jgi:hypothetical protein
LTRKLDLAIELPPDEFSICHTREAEFETSTFSDPNPIKRLL